MKISLPNQWWDRHMVMNGNDRALPFHGGGLQRLPVPAENNPFVIDLPVFLAELPVSVGEEVNALLGWYWYFGPEQTISAEWSSPTFHCASVEAERSLQEFCCDTIIWIFCFCPVMAGRSVL